MWLLKEFEDIHFLGKQRIFKAAPNVGDLRHESHKQEDVSYVQLPDALEDTGASQDEAALQHGVAVDERGRVARDEDKQLSCVAKPVIAKREPIDDVRRHVVEKDEPERKSSKE